MERNRCLARWVLHALLVGTVAVPLSANAQDFDRYKPLPLPSFPDVPQVQSEPLPPVEGSDRVLVESLDALLVLDREDKVDPDNGMDDLEGIQYDFDSADSLVFSPGFSMIANSYLGQPISLRSLNQLSRDIIEFYREMDQPVVDVIVPEQRITGGTVQIVVIESRVGNILIEEGCYFNADDLCPWIECTQIGQRIYESHLSNDLFWLNQNPFRRVNVDLRPGADVGTTDVVFQVNDVRPFNAYFGYEDTGVRTLRLERLYAGMIWGNAFGRGGSLSYQYTTDAYLAFLHAHAVTYVEPLNRDWSWQTYGSWARVSPAVLQGLIQNGESWIAGLGVVRHLKKTPNEDINLTFGFDFKQTNNNLEFGGINVSNTTADLAQLRMGYNNIWRCGQCDCHEYSLLKLDAYIGPGGGFSSAANTVAMNTIRPGTTPDYIYARGRYERLWNMPFGWELTGRVWGQIASDRLLFSETLGFGGYDSVRGYDQRAFSGDAGWIANLELGPRPWKWCGWGREQTFRVYGLLDGGGAYIKNRQPGDLPNETLASGGVGFRWNIDRRTSVRCDYAYTFQDVLFQQEQGRVHVGLVSLFGPRP